MSNQAHALRIYSNIKILLETGTFQGSVAHAVVEANQFISSLIEVLNVQEEAQQSAPSSDGNGSIPAQDEPGVGGSGVSDSKRGNRKRKSK